MDRLTRTVSRYLQFARGQSDADARADLAAAVTATLDLLEGEFRAREAALERELAGGPIDVRLDAESLRQVVLNLVLNALEACSGRPGRVRVALRRDGAAAELSVEDDGPGFPPDVLARQGEPFVTTKAQGTGLGLFLSRRLV